MNLERVQLIRHTPATGGLIVVDRRDVHRLTPIQFELLFLLGQRALEDAGKPEAVRGFVSSSELLGSLPWDTAHPDFNHVKQLIRRLRRRLSPLPIDLQSCFGLGYRLLLLEGDASQVRSAINRAGSSGRGDAPTAGTSGAPG